MNEGYKSIQGWFDFQDIYQQAVEEAVDGAHFVEVGTFKGRSAAFMAALIRDSGKRIQFDCVDTWKDVKGTPRGELFQVFRQDMERLQLTNYVNAVVAPSLAAVNAHLDRSLDLVFIDGDHSYGAVKADIEAWWPKVKFGGVLAGHDYRGKFAGVCKAVNEVLGKAVQRRKNSWWIRCGRAA